MIRNTANRRRAEQQNDNIWTSNFIETLHRELREHNYDLSDQICASFINQTIVSKSRFVKVELFFQPLSGVYEGI